MSQKQPSPGVKYRIQNLDHGKYLEFPNNEDREPAEGRDLLPTIKQQWTFQQVDPSRPTTYKILNVASVEGDIDAHYALSYDNVNNKPVVMAQDSFDTSVVWRIKINETRESCTIVTTFPAQTTPTARLQMNRDETIDLIGEAKIHDNQRWKLVPVSSTPDGPDTGPETTTTANLPQAIYRIRNSDSTAAITMHANYSPANPVSLVPQEATGTHQAWELIPKGGGEYVIKKAPEGGYLSWDKATGTYKAVTSAQPARWKIFKLGSSGYQLQPVIAGETLTLTGVDTNDIPLKTPSKDAANQKWLLDVDSGFEARVIQQDDAKRYSEIPNGKYILKNSSTGYYAAPVSGVPSRLQAYTSLTGNSSFHLEFQYENSTSPYFTIRSDFLTYLIPNGDEVALDNDPVLWYLLKTNNLYCLCLRGSMPRRSLVTSVLNSSWKFPLRNYDGYPDELWEITPSPYT